jgi:hypothetical protein
MRIAFCSPVGTRHVPANGGRVGGPGPKLEPKALEVCRLARRAQHDLVRVLELVPRVADELPAVHKRAVHRVQIRDLPARVAARGARR